MNLKGVIESVVKNMLGGMAYQDVAPFVSVMGEVDYFNTTGTSVTIASTSDGSTNMVAAVVASTTMASLYFDNGGANTGRIRYIGKLPRMLHLACSISVTPATSNDQFVLGIAKNGTVDPDCKAIQKMGTTADTQSTALHCMTDVVYGDYIELYVGNMSAGRNITIKSLNIGAVGSVVQ